MSSSSTRPALWMLCGAVLFATMAALTHGLGDRCDWLLIALVRSAVMLAVAVGLARSQGVPLVLFKPPTLWVRSLAGSLSLVCNFYAMTRLPVADAITLSSMYPLWILVLTGLTLRRAPRLAEVVGVVCGLAGVVLIERPDLGGARWAAGAALLGSGATAVAMLGLHRLRGVDTRAIVAHFAGVGSLITAGWLLARGVDLSSFALGTTTWAMLLGVALAGTGGQICLTRAYATGRPTQVSIVGLSQVAFALGFDLLIWDRALTLSAALGFVLVLAPTAWLAGRASRRLGEVRKDAAGPDNAPEPTRAATAAVPIRNQPIIEPAPAARARSAPPTPAACP